MLVGQEISLWPAEWLISSNRFDFDSDNPVEESSTFYSMERTARFNIVVIITTARVFAHRRRGVIRIQMLSSCTRVTVRGNGNSSSSSLTITLPNADVAEWSKEQQWISIVLFRRYLLYQTRHNETICTHSNKNESRRRIIVEWESINKRLASRMITCFCPFFGFSTNQVRNQSFCYELLSNGCTPTIDEEKEKNIYSLMSKQAKGGLLCFLFDAFVHVHIPSSHRITHPTSSYILNIRWSMLSSIRCDRCRFRSSCPLVTSLFHPR